MIKLLLKQIWVQRTVNAWLWVELVIVSVCLAYVADYLYVTADIYFSPLGYNTEHVYKVELSSVQPLSAAFIPDQTDNLRTSQLFDILARIRSYSGVEAVAVSRRSHPYNQGTSNGSYGIDTTWVHGYILCVSPEFFRVFRITDKTGQTDPLVSAATQENSRIISTEGERKFALSGIPALNSGIKNWKEKEPKHTVRAICSDVRFHDFQPVYPIYYECLSEAKLFEYDDAGTEICVRVRPEADGPDFITRFRKDMKTQLRLGNIYLMDVTSFADIRDNFFRSNGAINEVKTHFVGLAFLLTNILLGVVGTFWVRTRQRRSEMGIRLALGSSRAGLRRLLLGEGMVLLVSAIIPAILINLNLIHAELIREEGMPFTVERFLMVQVITFVLMAAMIVAGILPPSRQTMKIQPAEALHEE